MRLLAAERCDSMKGMYIERGIHRARGCVGAATILLLFIGIHNAWDNVLYVVIELSQPENKSQN
jgi:hypothetical protein